MVFHQLIFILLVEVKDDILTGCRLVDKDCIDVCNSIFIKMRVSTILHQPPQICPVRGMQGDFRVKERNLDPLTAT